MTDTTVHLLEEQSAILRAALDLQKAQLARAKGDSGRIDDLLNTIFTQNAQMLSALSMLREHIRHDQ